MEKSIQQPFLAACQPDIRPGLAASTTLQIAGALILGLVILYGVGFASMDMAHDAAHDARHSFSFPCH